MSVIVSENEEYTVGEENAYEPVIEGDLIVDGVFTATRDEQRRIADRDVVLTLIENWDNDAAIIREGELLYHLLTVYGGQLERLNNDIEDVHQNRFIDTAEGGHLDKIGEEVGVVRRQYEVDSVYRTRVKAGYARAASNSTFDTFARVVLNVLDVPEDLVTISTPESEPVVIINVPLSAIENSALSQDQIVEELTESTPSSDGVRIQSGGTFKLGAEGETTPEGSGLGEGTLGVMLSN